MSRAWPPLQLLLLIKQDRQTRVLNGDGRFNAFLF